MVVEFSKLDFNERPILILRNLDGTAIQVLGYAFNIQASLSYNEVSELSFDIPKYADGGLIPGYDEVVGMRIVDLLGVGQFLLIDPEEESDGIRVVKSCKAYSLEYEFALKNIYLEEGTYNFYSGIDTSDDSTIIGRIRERLPDWRFDIDESLIGKYRTFDDVNKKVYEFIKSDVQEKYGCIFDFDTYARIVHVRDVCSEVSTRQVFLSEDNLIKKIEINENSENIITCLDVYGADDVDIRSINPTGSNKIYNLDYFMNEVNFSSDFIDRWRKWEEDFSLRQDLYYDITVAYNMKLLRILTLEAEYSDMKAELISLENVQAVIIQGIAQGIKEQSDLSKANSDIAGKKAEMSKKDDEISSLKKEAEALHTRREEINAELSFENYFSSEELSILKRYFIEDTLEDDSFVAETSATYIEEDYSMVIDGTSISISSATSVDAVEDALGCKVYSIVGGELSVSSLSAKIIKGTLYIDGSGNAVFSAYSEMGKIGEASFNEGNITLSGMASSISSGGTSLSFKINDGRLYFSEKCTEYKRLQIERELYLYARELLSEKSTPSYNFSIDVCNFLSAEEFSLFKNQLTLGSRIYLDIGGKVLNPYVTSIDIDFEDRSNLSIDFSSSYSAFDKSFALSKLLEQSVSLGKTLSHKSGMYSAFVNSGASTAVKDFMDSALDISKNAVLSSKNQAIEYNDTGIRIRKWSDDTHTSYAPEEIWIVDNVIAFTEDNWNSAKMAIGKIFDPNLISDDNPTGMAYGIVADYLVGKIIAGQNLIIQATSEDGNTVTFKVDGSGAYLYNADINIVKGNTQVLLSPDFGIAIGRSSLFKEDDDGGKVINEDKAKFWVDGDGNVMFAGTLKGCDGEFSGSLKAATGSFTGSINVNDKFIVDSSGNLTAESGVFSGTVKGAKFKSSSGDDMMNSDEQFTSDYLDIKGLTVRNSSGKVTFKVDNRGNVTINGDVTIDGGISWGDISDIPSEVEDAYSLAEEVQDIVDGWSYTYRGKTYIDGGMLMTGTVIASKLLGGEVGLLDEDETKVGGIYLRSASSSDYAVELYSDGALSFSADDGDLYLSTYGNFIRLDRRNGVYIGASDYGSMRLLPASDCDYVLGNYNHMWREIYCETDEINTSDARSKKDIGYDMSGYEDFFYSIKPVRYKFKKNTSDRYHVGFISQDIEEALLSCGLTSSDFAGFIKTPHEDDDEYSYGLRYGEFIALNTHMIQKLSQRIDELEGRLKEFSK